MEQAQIKLNPKALEEIESVRELVTQLRALKAERNLSNNREVEFFYVAEDSNAELIANAERSILDAVGAKALKKVESQPTGLPAVVSNLGSFYLDLTSGINLEAEISRMQKEIENLSKIILSIESKLNNEKFVSQAPEKVVAGAKAQLAENQVKLKESNEILNALTASH